MGSDKVSKDFLSKVNAIKAHPLGKNKKNIDSRFEYTAISVWLIDCSEALSKSEKEYLQNLKTEYVERYIGVDIVGKDFENIHENPSLENFEKLVPHIEIFGEFNKKLKLKLYEEDKVLESDKNSSNAMTDKTDERPIFPPEQ